MRALQRLTARGVQTKKKAGYYPDGAGLYLVVGESGTKSWIHRYMLRGRSREMGIGSETLVSLAEARERVKAGRKLLAEGVDPLEARRALLALQGEGKTFAECATAYIDAHEPGWRNAKHAGQWRSTIKTYCEPIAALPVQSIDTGRVMRVLSPLWSTKPETATRLRGRIERILSWATVRGFRAGENPARWRGHLNQLLPKPANVARVKHHAALPFAQVGSFVADLRGEEGIAALALEFTILTAARTGEAIGIKPAIELDLSGAVWTVPGERMKGGREHRVPLSARAVEIARAMMKDHPGEYLFPGQQAGRHLSNMAMLKLLRRMGRDDLTTHGFRSTFRDWASETTSFPGDVVEMALAHAIKGKTEAAYRRGDLFEKRRRLMDAWAAHVGKVRPAGKVTPIKAAA